MKESSKGGKAGATKRLNKSIELKKYKQTQADKSALDKHQAKTIKEANESYEKSSPRQKSLAKSFARFARPGEDKEDKGKKK